MHVNKNLAKLYRIKDLEVIGEPFWLPDYHGEHNFDARFKDVKEHIVEFFPNANAFFEIASDQEVKTHLFSTSYQACRVPEEKLIEYWKDDDSMFYPLEEIEDLEKKLENN